MGTFQKLSGQLRQYLSPNELAQISEAYQFANQRHHGQKRYSGEPYITHPLATAIILANMHMDAPSLIAAILHDVLEDTETDKNTLAENFGLEVAELVDSVSNFDGMLFQTYVESKAANLSKIIRGMTRDMRTIVIKLADRLHNIHTCEALPLKKRQRIARETLEIYAPLAARLGINAIGRDMEDMSFTALFPWRSNILRQTLASTEKRYRKTIQAITSTCRKKLKGYRLKHHIIIRYPSLKEIYQHLRSKQPLKNFLETLVLKIIVDDQKQSCYQVLGILHQAYQPVQGQLHDHIAVPKQNGYHALCTAVIAETLHINVHIQTKTMYEMSELGVVARFQQKNTDNIILDKHVATESWFQYLQESEHETSSAQEFVEHFKADLSDKTIFVYTSQGDTRELPIGATPLDLAFAIDTKLGTHCKSCRINNHHVALNYSLSTGDRVHIETDSTPQVKRAWLDVVTTGKARSAINFLLRQRRDIEHQQLGEKLLSQALVSSGFSLMALAGKSLKRALETLGVKDIQTIFAEIGSGKRQADSTAKTLAKTATPMTKQVDAKPLMVDHYVSETLAFSHCCHPIPGDAIIGCLSPDNKVIIHNEYCTAIAHDKNVTKVNVAWAQDIKSEFPCKIRLEVINRTGIICELSEIIRRLAIMIRSMQAQELEGNVGLIDLEVNVANVQHTKELIRQLEKVKDVIKVTRGSDTLSYPHYTKAPTIPA